MLREDDLFQQSEVVDEPTAAEPKRAPGRAPCPTIKEKRSKHFRNYPKVSTSAQQDVGRSSGCTSSTSAGWFRVWTTLPAAMQANPCHLRQTSTKCANCVQLGKNTSSTMQAIQSLILPQTMSPDDFYRFSALLSFIVLDVPLRFTTLPFVSPIFTIWLAVLRVSFWWDVWYFEAVRWRRRTDSHWCGCIGWIRVLLSDVKLVARWYLLRENLC